MHPPVAWLLGGTLPCLLPTVPLTRSSDIVDVSVWGPVFLVRGRRPAIPFCLYGTSVDRGRLPD